MNHETKDAQLLAGIARQNHQDFAEFVSRYLFAITKFIRRYFHNHAQVEDIAQDVFLKVWQHAAQWQVKTNGSPRAWLYRITYNRCIDLLRKQKPATEDVDNLVSHLTPEKILMDDAKQAQFKHAMAQLPERQRTALYLCTYQGLSNKEAAETLAISIDALESLLSRARRKLHEQLHSFNEGQNDRDKAINE